MGTIQINKTDSINQIYQIMVVSMLKNWGCKYSSYYIIKFIDFIPIYYAINLYIVSSFMFFTNLYFRSIDIMQVSIKDIIFP